MVCTIRLAAVFSARCSSPNSMRGTPACSATNAICAMNIASSAASGPGASRAARSTRASRWSATHSITACQIASLLGKWRNRAPWVSFIEVAIAAVVISLGFCSAASLMTASMVTARRSSAGRCLRWMSMVMTR